MFYFSLDEEGVLQIGPSLDRPLEKFLFVAEENQRTFFVLRFFILGLQ